MSDDVSNNERQTEAEPNADRKEKTDDDDETLTQVSDLNEGKSKRKSTKSTKSSRGENEEKRKLFFQEELKRLQRSLDAESSKIHKPPVKEYVPYCFNALGPYYDTKTAEHLIIKTDDQGKLKDTVPEYATRQTAIGLVDPWVNHKMDHEVSAPIKVKEHQPFRQTPKKEKKVGEGSTMIPVFPHVDMDTPDLASRELNYNDVPALRKELRDKYSSQGKAKIEKDYERTKVDFYRMELHRLKDVHPVNRGNMKKAYFAYLQNTPGSKKAVKECVKVVVGEKSADDEGEKAEDEKSAHNDQEEEQHQNGDEQQDEAEREAVEA